MLCRLGSTMPSIRPKDTPGRNTRSKNPFSIAGNPKFQTGETITSASAANNRAT
jgi:hypothetical protein